jgi:hypothetical protein
MVKGPIAAMPAGPILDAVNATAKWREDRHDGGMPSFNAKAWTLALVTFAWQPSAK